MPARPSLPRLALWGGTLAAVALVVLFLRVVSRPVRERAQLAELGSDFTIFHAPPFIVYTTPTLPENRSKTFASELGHFIDAFLGGPGKELGLKPFESEITLVLFPDLKALQTYFRETTREVVYNLGAYYDPVRRILAVPTGEGPFTEESARHEAVHLCLDAASGTVLPKHSHWVEEGCATYFGASRFDRDLNRWHFGGIQRNLLDDYREARRLGKAPSVTATLDAGASEFSGPDNGLYYAVAHFVIAWVFDGPPERRAAFVDLVKQERLSGPGGAPALASRLGVFPDALGREIEAWIDRLPAPLR